MKVIFKISPILVLCCAISFTLVWGVSYLKRTLDTEFCKTFDFDKADSDNNSDSEENSEEDEFDEDDETEKLFSKIYINLCAPSIYSTNFNLPYLTKLPSSNFQLLVPPPKA